MFMNLNHLQWAIFYGLVKLPEANPHEYHHVCWYVG